MDRLVGEPIEHAPEAVLLRPIRVFPHKATHLEQVGRSFLHLRPCAERRTSYGAPRTASVALCGKTNPARLTARRGTRCEDWCRPRRDVGPSGLGRQALPRGGRLSKAGKEPMWRGEMTEPEGFWLAMSGGAEARVLDRVECLDLLPA